jgi:hypothetical protein
MVLAYLADTDLRIGMRVEGIGPNAALSDGYVNNPRVVIPEPSTFAMPLIGPECHSLAFAVVLFSRQNFRLVSRSAGRSLRPVRERLRGATAAYLLQAQHDDGPGHYPSRVYAASLNHLKTRTDDVRYTDGS